MTDDPFRVQEATDKRLRVGRDRHQWVEANFVAPDITDEHAILYSQTDGYMGTVLHGKNILHIGIALAVAFTIIVSRAAYIQIAQGAWYGDQSDANRLRHEYIYADRGLMYDRFQHPLVRNIPNYTAAIRPRLLPADQQERTTLLTSLYQDHFLHVTTETLHEFTNRLEQARSNPSLADQELLVAESIPQDQAIILQIQSQDIPALTVSSSARRQYLNEGPTGGENDDTNVYHEVKSLSHVLGYMTHLQTGEYDTLKTNGYLFNDTIGRTGLESSYESLLRGVNGKKEIEVDAQGRFKQILSQSTPIDGKSLQTSLDLEFQRFVEATMQKRLAEKDKTAGAVIALDPRNGEVLALVNIPTYDDNLFSAGLSAEQANSLFNDPQKPLFDRAISGEYPSGSIFKPIVAVAALQEGIISDRTTYISAGGLEINNFFFPDWKAGGHGATNIYKAIAESVNTYFYIIGGGYQNMEGLGVQRITDYAKTFGLSQPLGLDLPGEASGFLPSKEWKEQVKQERWYVGDTYHLAIGQGDLLVTPLQMAAVISSFANGGILYQPHLVTAILDEQKRVEKKIEPVVLSSEVADPDMLQIVRSGLRQVVTVGSGRRLSDLPIQVSGKTGTAQWHSQKDPHAWFVGFAPSRNPTIAFAVLVEEGKEGSDLPVTIAHDLLTWWAENRL